MSYLQVCVCYMCAKSLQLCPILCDLTDCSPPGSSVHGILQARILEWVAMPFSKGSFQLRNQTHISYVPCIGGSFFTTTKLMPWEHAWQMGVGENCPWCPAPFQFRGESTLFLRVPSKIKI